MQKELLSRVIDEHSAMTAEKKTSSQSGGLPDRDALYQSTRRFATNSPRIATRPQLSAGTWPAVLEWLRKSPEFPLVGTDFQMFVHCDRAEPATHKLSATIGMNSGRCMDPHLIDGDLILFETVAGPRDVAVGDLVAVRMGDEKFQQAVIKVACMFGGQWCFLSRNHPPIAADRFDATDGTGVIGRVVAFLHRSTSALKSEQEEAFAQRCERFILDNDMNSQAYRDQELGAKDVSLDYIQRIVDRAFKKFVPQQLE